MTDIDVELGTHRLGSIYRDSSSSGERISFRYSQDWLASAERFAIDPELFLDPRTTTPSRAGLFGAFSDCAPNRWGRQLMQRQELCNLRIGLAATACLAHAANVHFRQSPPQGTHDIVVEVFVGREASHCPAARRASKRALRPSGGSA